MLVMHFIFSFVFIQQISKSNQLSLTTFFLTYFSLFHFHFPFHFHCFCLLLFYGVMSSSVFRSIESCPYLLHPCKEGKKLISFTATTACQRPAKIRSSNIRHALEFSLQRLNILPATKIKHEELNQVSLHYTYSKTPRFPGT